jgi:hypothetical protein
MLKKQGKKTCLHVMLLRHGQVLHVSIMLCSWDWCNGALYSWPRCIHVVHGNRGYVMDKLSRRILLRLLQVIPSTDLVGLSTSGRPLLLHLPRPLLRHHHRRRRRSRRNCIGRHKLGAVMRSRYSSSRRSPRHRNPGCLLILRQPLPRQRPVQRRARHPRRTPRRCPDFLLHKNPTQKIVSPPNHNLIENPNNQKTPIPIPINP